MSVAPFAANPDAGRPIFRRREARRWGLLARGEFDFHEAVEVDGAVPHIGHIIVGQHVDRIARRQHDRDRLGIIAEQPNANVIKNVNDLKSQFSMNYPLVWFSNQAVNDYGQINGIPRTFVLNKDGEIVADFEGARPYTVFKKAVEPWL